MTKFVALLRGVNVGGKSIKINRLAASFEAAGCSAVATYIQSGNVVFEPPAGAAPPDPKRIEERILQDFGLAVRVILRSAEELGRAINENPLPRIEGVDPAKLHVTFLSAPAPANASATLRLLAAAQEQFSVQGGEIYLYCPHGYGVTKLSNNAIEKKLGLAATTRNWKTVNALFAMASQNLPS